ncbi:hypothetical protein BGLA2_720020 [Burkholderia gladioli]|nr:hypothetical protein BGLA2_720020 [Burkholderia gladioli]
MPRASLPSPDIIVDSRRRPRRGTIAAVQACLSRAAPTGTAPPARVAPDCASRQDAQRSEP